MKLMEKKIDERNKNELRSESNKTLFFEKQIEHKWLSTKEAAAYLALSENALRIMVHRQLIPSYKFRSRLRFKLSDCQALFKTKGA